MTQCVALVTGGAKRIGRAICRNLAQNDCSVYIHYHTSQQEASFLQAEITSNGYVAHIVQADLRDEVSITSMIRTIEQKSGRLDYLVNNAAVFPRRPLCLPKTHLVLSIFLHKAQNYRLHRLCAVSMDENMSS